MNFRPTYALLIICLSLLLPSLSQAVENVEFKLKNTKSVIFNHKIHLGKLNNDCKACHSSIYKKTGVRGVTMAQMESGKSCGACHNGKKAFSVASDADCDRCHRGIPRGIIYRSTGAGNVVFSHDTHLANTGDKCKACHGKIALAKVSMAQMEKGQKCGACHNDKKAFTVVGNCDRCHKGFKPGVITFKVKDAGNAAFKHDIHLGMYKCPDCHTKLFPFRAGAKKTTMADMETGKSCGACHSGKEAFSVKGDCDKCHKM